MGELIFKPEKTFLGVSEQVLWSAMLPCMWYFLKCFSTFIRHTCVMRRTNVSYLSLLGYFFFFSEKCFFNISSSLPDSSWETDSSTFSLRLFIIKSYLWWMTAWDEVPAFTQASTSGLEEKNWEAPLLPSLWLCSALSRPQALSQDRSVWGITYIRIQLQGPAWRFQGYGGHRLAVPWPPVVPRA